MGILTKGFAGERGAELALADDFGELTWAELDDAVNRAVHALRNAGLGAGDTIAIVAGNRNEWFVLSLACAHAGIVHVPVNWHLVAPELAYIFGDSGAKAVFAGHRFVDVVHQALDDPRSADIAHTFAFVDPESGITDDRFSSFEQALATASAVEPDDQVMGGPMFYTSGTTGHPKGVRGSLTNVGDEVPAEVWQLIAAGFSDLLTVPGVSVLCGPVYHSAQWAFSWLPMIAGSAVVHATQVRQRRSA